MGKVLFWCSCSRIASSQRDTCASNRVYIEFAYKRGTGGWRWGGLVHGTCRTRRPHSRLGRASCTAYTASAGAEGRSVVSFLSAPLQAHVPRPPCPHAQPNLVKPRSSSFQRSLLVLLPLHHQHSTAQHCAFAAPSPPMMLPLLPLLPLPPPMVPVPVSPRALAPRGLGLSTRPSRYRRSNRVFYSRNPHCDCGLGQRSGHASLDKGRDPLTRLEPFLHLWSSNPHPIAALRVCVSHSTLLTAASLETIREHSTFFPRRANKKE